MERKIEMMQQGNAEGCQGHQKLRERLEPGPPLESGRKALGAQLGPTNTLISDFQLPEF